MGGGAACLYSRVEEEGAKRLTMRRSSPSLTTLSSPYPFNPLPASGGSTKATSWWYSLFNIFIVLWWKDFGRYIKKNNPWVRRLNENLIHTIIRSPWRAKGSATLCCVQGTKAGLLLCYRIPANKVTNLTCMNTHRCAVTCAQNRPLWSYVCRVCRDGGVTRTWTLEGNRSCLAPSCWGCLDSLLTGHSGTDTRMPLQNDPARTGWNYTASLERRDSSFSSQVAQIWFVTWTREQE